MSVGNLVSISIATKDRPDVLEETLQKIHAFGLGGYPLIICDDGSNPPLAPKSLALFSKGRLIRNEFAQGQASARNRIARECDTPYLLQLDDDSYPVGGDLAGACEYLRNVTNCLAIGFAFEEPSRNRCFTANIHSSDFVPIWSFVGCAVLVDVDGFLSLGGYAGEWIGWAAEEDELAIRAAMAGKTICFSGIFQIRHDVSDKGRDLNAISFQSFRNWLWIWRVYAPALMLPVLVGSLVLRALYTRIVTGNGAAWKGVKAGFMKPACGALSRTPVSLAVYRKFRSLPHHLDIAFDGIVSHGSSRSRLTV